MRCLVERAQEAVAASRARILEEWRRSLFLAKEALQLAQDTRDRERWAAQIGVEP